ncbi:SusC/RagA family TonB-linked outer membrane protein [Mucilaginibacter aquatilis]|nr:TonB-dependent receptor [Mucilaginibacter aquatilis]
MEKQLRFNLLLVLMLCCITAFGQTSITVKGTITDRKGEPLPGVNIKIKNLQKSTVSNAQGNYTIVVPSGEATLVFTYVGFNSHEEPVNKRTLIRVTLEEQNNALNDVVVIGYGTVRKGDLTGSVSQVKVEDLQKAPVRSFEEALAGRVAGVQVSSPEGQPGNASNIVIRGNSSITQDNSPLYVIDGFPIENPNNNVINPSEIESLEVLKDASATAIYGARGANGVIIITTKKGKTGAPVITYDGYYGFQNTIKEAKLMSPYEFVRYQLELDPVSYTGVYTPDGTTLDSYRNVQGIDWQKQVFRTAPMQSHNFAMRGGNNQTLYSFSGSVLGQDGVIINSGFKRYQGRLSLDQTLKNNIKVGVNVNFSNTKTNGATPSTYNGTSNSLSLLYSVWGYRPIIGGVLPNEDLLELPLDPGVDGTGDYRYNPILSAQNEVNLLYNNTLIANAYAQIPLFKDLTLRISGGVTREARKQEIFYNTLTKYGDPRSAQGSNGANGRLYNFERNDYLNENTLTYKKTINKAHTITALAGFTMQKQDNQTFGYQSNRLPNESLGVSGLEEGVLVNATSAKTNNLLVSYLSRVNYSYKSKYLLTASIRADGSSKFASDNHWSYFPSGAFAWRISDEKFLKKYQFLSSAKLRTSIGVTGNNRVSDFAYLPTITFPISGNYTFENGYYTGAIPTSLGNKNLKWETTRQIDAGVDISLFSSRINLTVDYYNKNTYDLLLNAQLPVSTGYQSGFQNIGKVSNTGWEFELSTVNIAKKDFQWNSSFNITFNRNKVLELTRNQESIGTALAWETGYNNIPAYIAKIGNPIGLLYGYKWLGNYQYSDFDQQPDGRYVLKSTVPDNGSGRTAVQPGDIKYEDINGDGTVNASDRMVIGNPNPDFIGGFSNNFTYKGFDLNVFLQWSFGNDALNANRLVFEGTNRLSLNQFASYADRWTPENPNNEYFRTKGYGPTAYSSRIIEDASYIRVKTVALGYTLPAKWLKKTKMRSVRVYASAQNLLTFTNYSGLDPEVSTKNSALTPGFDFAAYPRAKTVVFGLSLSL